MPLDRLAKIAIVGPESTGKSTLAQFLGEEFDSISVPEYARYYCQNLNNQYTLQDEVNMFYGQMALEEALIPLAKHNLLFCDVTILTIKIWCDHLFGDTPNEVKEEIKNRKYDLYLLMDIDLPWQDDPLRDFPKDREYFLEVWKKELADLNANYKIISGLGEERIENGKMAVSEFLNLHK
ncbi:AAA family ATPase [Sphingobacterium hungaricum]